MSTSTAPSQRHLKCRRIVGVSTKMYFSLSKTTTYVSTFLSKLESLPALELDKISLVTDIFIIPDFISLKGVSDQLQFPGVGNTNTPPILVGAQDCHWEDYGSFTGEVSPAVLASAGCWIVELGHAERRRWFGETDGIVARKAAAVVRHGMIPLVCVGELSPPPATGNGIKGEGLEKAVDEVMVQVRSVLDAIEDKEAEVILAYEPVWAIGAEEPAGVDHVLGVVGRIRESEEFKARSEGSVRILYGGSAGPGLFDKLKSELDGLFLGRFAHDPEQFIKTIREVAEA